YWQSRCNRKARSWRDQIYRWKRARGNDGDSGAGAVFFLICAPRETRRWGFRGAHAPRVLFPAPRRKGQKKSGIQSEDCHISKGLGKNTRWHFLPTSGESSRGRNETLSCKAPFMGMNACNTNSMWPA